MSDGTFTDYKVHQWLQEVANGAWVSLHYDSPSLGGVGASEISGGGYKRSKVPFSQPSNRTIWSLGDARFTGLTQNQLTHFGIWDKTTLGNLVAYGRLPSTRVVLNGQGYVIFEGELAISFG